MIASLALTSLLALPSLFKSVSATPAEPSIAGRATCTVTGAQNAGTDDVPAIKAAIASCSTGTVVLSAGVTYALRSTLDLSECSGCTIAIEGTLKLSDDLDYWEGKQAAILVNGVTGATITSQTSTGLVDGNGVPFWTGTPLNHIPESLLPSALSSPSIIQILTSWCIYLAQNSPRTLTTLARP